MLENVSLSSQKLLFERSELWKILFFLLLMLFLSVCHQVSNQTNRWISSSGDYILLSANVSPTYSNGLFQGNVFNHLNRWAKLYYKLYWYWRCDWWLNVVTIGSKEWTRRGSSIPTGCSPVSSCPELPSFACACLSSSRRCSQLQQYIRKEKKLEKFALCNNTIESCLLWHILPIIFTLFWKTYDLLQSFFKCGSRVVHNFLNYTMVQNSQAGGTVSLKKRAPRRKPPSLSLPDTQPSDCNLFSCQSAYDKNETKFESFPIRASNSADNLLYFQGAQKLVFHQSKCICAIKRILSTTAMYVSSSSFMYFHIPCYCDACLISSGLHVGVKTLLNTIQSPWFVQI